MATIRGTTPTHKIATSVSLVGATEIYVTYKQLRRTVLEKTLDDIKVTEEGIEIALTQQDTLIFESGKKTTAQIRAKFKTGQVVASNKMKINIESIYKGGVI